MNYYFPSPSTIKDELDKYIIGQEYAKRILSVAAYKHMQLTRLQDRNLAIQKANIMLIGPSGCGKTYLVKNLARILEVPYVIADATEFVQTGYKGNNVDLILQRLIDNAEGDLEKAEHGIVFIDEIDKKAAKNYFSSGIDHAGIGVQQSLLKMIEDGKSIVNNDTAIDTTNILFIVGGAFVGLDKIVKQRTTTAGAHRIGFDIEGGNTSEDTRTYSELMSELLPEDICKFGFMQEFVGRFPEIVTLDALTEEQLCDILTKPNNSLIKQYDELLLLDNFHLQVMPSALKAIARKAIERGTGARGLRGILEKLLLWPMYSAPSVADNNIGVITITKEMVEQGYCNRIKGKSIAPPVRNS